MKMQIVKVCFLVLLTFQISATSNIRSRERKLVDSKEVTLDNLANEIDNLQSFDEVHFLNVASGSAILAKSSSNEDGFGKVLFGMRDKDHSYIQELFYTDQDKKSLPTNEGIKHQMDELLKETQGGLTLFMTHNRDISYEGFNDLNIQNLLVTKLLKEEIDKQGDTGFAKYYKEKLSNVEAHPIQGLTMYGNRVLVLNADTVTQADPEEGIKGDKMYIIKSGEKVFLITGHANCNTLGVDCHTCEIKDEQNAALQALKKVTTKITHFMYPNYSAHTHGANCPFRIFRQEEINQGDDVPLEAIIVSAGIQNQIAQPSRLAVQDFVDYYSYKNQEQNEQKMKRLLYFRKEVQKRVRPFKNEIQSLLYDDDHSDVQEHEDEHTGNYSAARHKDQLMELILKGRKKFQIMVDLKQPGERDNGPNNRSQIVLAQTRYPIYTTSVLGRISYEGGRMEYANEFECSNDNIDNGVANCYTDFIGEDHNMKLGEVNVIHADNDQVNQAEHLQNDVGQNNGNVLRVIL